MMFPQYSKTNDPEVLAVIERNRIGRKEVLQRACDFSKLHGDTAEGSVFTSDFIGFTVTGIVSEAEPASGRWKRLPRARNGWVPYKNNPLHAELESFAHKQEPIPGAPGMLESGYGVNGTQKIANPSPFVLDEFAYLGFSFQPVNPKPAGSTWEEIKASELHAAMEAYNERVAK